MRLVSELLHNYDDFLLFLTDEGYDTVALTAAVKSAYSISSIKDEFVLRDLYLIPIGALSLKRDIPGVSVSDNVLNTDVTVPGYTTEEFKNAWSKFNFYKMSEGRYDEAYDSFLKKKYSEALSIIRDIVYEMYARYNVCPLIYTNLKTKIETKYENM